MAADTDTNLESTHVPPPRFRCTARAFDKRVAASFLALLVLASGCGQGTTSPSSGGAASWHVLQESKLRQAFRGLWGSSGRDVFAVGERGTTLRFDGRAWRATETPSQSILACLWANAGDDAFAAGLAGVMLHYGYD